MGHKIQEELSAFIVPLIKEEEEDKCDGSFDWGNLRKERVCHHGCSGHIPHRCDMPADVKSKCLALLNLNAGFAFSDELVAGCAYSDEEDHDVAFGVAKDDDLYILPNNSDVTTSCRNPLSASSLLFRLQIEGVPADKKKARHGH